MTSFLGVIALLLILGGIALGVRSVTGHGGYSGDPRGADVVKFEIDSDAVGRSEPVSLVIPPGAKDTGRPVLVFLHGRSGDEDPFLPGDDALEGALAASGIDFTEHRWPGAHDGDYWNSHWDEYLDFYADALEKC